ncbi:hypothetical protein K1T71_014596 [Dendrolimus kikuchii]|uniref:Uncharacterized protein n=1 Tax=Dendrolimus kikuchii TaxID=765133 RepID=A0ACC1CES2_9NEOP|nr:hypothetical protein K1T71_014596 [Dendrolimus kikuchii]
MEFDEIVVKESPGLCRCCLSEGCYKDLGSEYTWMNEAEVYADMLLECFDISITQHNEGPNGPSRLICEVCITRLRDACNFKKQVLDSEKKFIDMLGRGEFRPKVLIYQTQMKTENNEEQVQEEVEYLEDDLDFDDDEVLKPSVDEHSSALETVTSETISLKRKLKTKKTKISRPKKHVEVDEKPKSSKAVSKDFNCKEIEQQNYNLKAKDSQRKYELIKFLTVVIENSTVCPFRWASTFMCFYCNCPFYEATLLREHMKAEHSDIKITSTYKSMLGNTKIKLDITEIRCKRCSEHFEKFDDFLTHAAKVHSLEFNPEVANWLFSFKLTSNDCRECGQSFICFSSLLKHAHKYHNKSLCYVCEICGQGFVAKSNVDGHVRNVHLTSNKCNICNKQFSGYNAYKAHYDKEHKRFKCPKCPEVLSSWYLKRKHMTQVHDSKLYKFECDLCDKIFTFSSKLQYHKSNVHYRNKPLQCEVCAFKAYSRESLKRHMVRHDDSRPFQCGICMKSFQRKKNLDIHVRIHTNDRRCVCKECGKAFVQTTSLKLHMRVHHPELQFNK